MAITETAPPGAVKRGGRLTRREAEESVKRVLAIAQRHFLAHGYNETSLDAIAREAGVAKKTLYHHFGSKAGLFGEIVAQCRNSRIAELSSIMLASPEPEHVLRQLALHLLDFLTRPERVKLHKLVVLEVSRFPKLVRAVMYDKGGKLSGMEPLRSWFRDAVAAGKLEIDDPDLAADQFVHLVLGGIRDRIILGVVHRPDAAQRERIADQAVKIFLAGTRKQNSDIRDQTFEI
ncbi:MAG TPA: TetR/AcrR family transcriptional regulator C-terminal domain-containing protein [Micropepsaceae bacterium]|nr:TetR/AcrR family transcriptional regulator C-terminal domain-containing protein [Micropepsaceae bacterium]